MADSKSNTKLDSASAKDNTLSKKPISTPLTAICHCGNVSVTAPRKPEYINECQCGICYRYGAEWAYYEPAEVEIHLKEGASTKMYIWGDRLLQFHACDHCGCVMYWWPIYPEDNNEMGLNARMIDQEELKRVERRKMFMD